MLRKNICVAVAALSLLCALVLLTPNCAFSEETSIAKLRAKLSELSEITLTSGVNEVELFAAPAGVTDPDVLQLFGANGNTNAPLSHRGKILLLHAQFLGARDDYDLYQVVTAGVGLPNQWNVIPRDHFDDEDPGGDSFTDATTVVWSVYDIPKSVRFFRGKFGDQLTTLLLVAKCAFSRDKDHDNDPPGGRVHIALYQLQVSDARAPAILARIADAYTEKTYCNADIALERELGVASRARIDHLPVSPLDGCYVR